MSKSSLESLKESFGFQDYPHIRLIRGDKCVKINYHFAVSAICCEHDDVLKVQENVLKFFSNLPPLNTFGEDWSTTNGDWDCLLRASAYSFGIRKEFATNCGQVKEVMMVFLICLTQLFATALQRSGNTMISRELAKSIRIFLSKVLNLHPSGWVFHAIDTYTASSMSEHEKQCAALNTDTLLNQLACLNIADQEVSHQESSSEEDLSLSDEDADMSEFNTNTP